MIRPAGLESMSSIPQTSSHNILPALISSLPSSSSSSTNPRQRQNRQQKPQQLSQKLTSYHPIPLADPLIHGRLQSRNTFPFLPRSRQQREGDFLLRSSPIQRLQLPAPASSRGFYRLTGTGFNFTPDHDHGYDHEVVRLREQGLGCS